MRPGLLSRPNESTTICCGTRTIFFFFLHLVSVSPPGDRVDQERKGVDFLSKPGQGDFGGAGNKSRLTKPIRTNERRRRRRQYHRTTPFFRSIIDKIQCLHHRPERGTRLPSSPLRPDLPDTHRRPSRTETTTDEACGVKPNGRT